MSLLAFLDSLVGSQRVSVPRPAEGDLVPTAEVLGAIFQIDVFWREQIGGSPPALELPAAVWAVQRMFRACQFLVYREIEADPIRRDLAIPCPMPSSPSVCYSVDVALRFLPDVYTLAGGIARDDPLVESLRRLGREWPLSSVGIEGLGGLDLQPFVHEPTLRRLYVDRIIHRKDVSRLEDPLVLDAAKAAIGAYPDLAPEIWRFLNSKEKAKTQCSVGSDR